MKAARYFFVIVLALVLTSCEFEETNLGFPKSITFTSNGGEKTITGEESFVFAEIQDYKGNHGSIEGGDNGKLYNVYDWLRVEYVELGAAYTFKTSFFNSTYSTLSQSYTL